MTGGKQLISRGVGDAPATRTTAKLTYFILYGLAEGPGHGRSLRRLLTAAGYILATSADEADLVIAHSAGTWQLGQDLPAKLILAVGTPLGRGRRLRLFLEANTKVVISFYHYPITQSLRICLWHAVYLIGSVRQSMHFMRLALERSELPVVARGQLVVVANQHDPWPQAGDITQLVAAADHSYIGLPGAHDHIWQEPAEYVRIINWYAARLLD